MKLNAGRLLMGGLLIVLASMDCSAQMVSSFEQLQTLAKPGDNIYVTDSSGNTTKGRIAELSPSSLGLVVKGARRDLVQADVWEIRQWRGDSLKNGTLIGAAVGGGFVTLGMVGLCRYDGCPAGPVIGGIALATGVGAAIGLGLDALIPAKQTIFWNRDKASGKLQIRPVLDRSNKGVKVAFSF